MTERQKGLYKYLIENATNTYLDRDTICNALPHYYPRAMEKSNSLNSSAFRYLREDIELINMNYDVDRVIISKGGKYKIASNEDEALRYTRKLYRAAIKVLARVNCIHRKLGRHNQFRINIEKIEPIKVFEVDDE